MMQYLHAVEHALPVGARGRGDHDRPRVRRRGWHARGGAHGAARVQCDERAE
jgi:hypothetical protein